MSSNWFKGFKSMLKDATALEKELQILSLLSSHGNPNLVGFHGNAWHFSNFTHHVGIVLQYCAGGMVTHYLDEIRYQDSFPSNVKPQMFKTLDKWSIQIVNAMKYLESRNIIHGDLAARNVLLDGHQNAKLADFGMSPKLYQYQEYALPGQSRGYNIVSFEAQLIGFDFAKRSYYNYHSNYNHTNYNHTNHNDTNYYYANYNHTNYNHTNYHRTNYH
ncbi:discoidin domain-containing receptor 2-like [Folsomia candida]|uniref:discoidin domain-containing receptor 2-like n=1 Tax=Folsomia candida TaxID=158441 RepID=UPI00160519C2|nr:discoidin domain-containing receptor 2-like [Folsomia candida]